jgi:transcriptional regulator with XRE-family HTH domain
VIKIKLIRSLKSWTQEEVANKLGITTHSYAKIERGETDVNFSRLQQIVCQVNSSIEQSENKHELEKANLIIEQLKKEFV